MVTHGWFVSIALMTAAGFFGLIAFARELNVWAVRAMKFLAALTFVLVVLVDITGAYGYVWYRLPAPTSPRSIILKTDPFAHQILFENMEYVSLMGPILSAVITYLVFHFGGDLVKPPAAPWAVRSVASLLVLAVILTFALSYAGVIPTRIAAVK